MIYLGKIKKFNNIYHEQNIFIACRERKSRKQMYTNIYISLCSSAAHPATSYFIQPYTTFLYKSPTPCYVPSPRWMLNYAHVKELTRLNHNCKQSLFSLSEEGKGDLDNVSSHPPQHAVFVHSQRAYHQCSGDSVIWTTIHKRQREAQCITGKSPPTITRCWAEQKSPTLEEGFTGIIWITIM